MSKSIVLLFLIWSISKPVSAQFLLPTVKVKATKEVSDFSYTKSNRITTEELETSPISLAALQIEKVPGVVANQNGGPGGRVSYFFRGTESRHVAFTLDGLKLNDPSNNDRQFDSAFFTSAFLADMDIHLGPQSVLFGSDAMGGLVELKSRKGKKAPESRFTMNGGSFGTYSSSISKDWRSLKENGTLTVTRFHTDGISRLNKKRFNAKERDAADITQLTSSSEHRWTDKLQTDFLLSFLRGENELDGFTTDNSNDNSENDQYLIQQKTSYSPVTSSAISYRTGLNRHQRRINTLTAGKEAYEGNLVQNEVLHRIEFNQINALTGVSTDHEDLKIKSLDRSFDTHSLFHQLSLNLSPIRLHGGIRVDKHTQYGNFFSSSAGLAIIQIAHTWSIQFSQGYKAPSLYQLHGQPLFGTPIGNPNLVPERNNSVELGWKRKGEVFDAQILLFQNRLSRLITFTNQGFVNQRSFITEGAEASLLYKSEFLQIGPSLNHQAFLKEESPVLRRPYNTFGLNLNYLPNENLVFSSRVNWQDSRKDIDPYGKLVKLNPYETVDVSAKYLMEKWDFGIQFTNIFDREYENLFGYGVTPRSVFLHLGFII